MASQRDGVSILKKLFIYGFCFFVMLVCVPTCVPKTLGFDDTVKYRMGREYTVIWAFSSEFVAGQYWVKPENKGEWRPREESNLRPAA